MTFLRLLHLSPQERNNPLGCCVAAVRPNLQAKKPTRRCINSCGLGMSLSPAALRNVVIDPLQQMLAIPGGRVRSIQ